MKGVRRFLAVCGTAALNANREKWQVLRGVGLGFAMFAMFALARNACGADI
jgi:hypothetical protein